MWMFVLFRILVLLQTRVCWSLNFIFDSFCFWKTRAVKVFVLHFVKTLISFPIIMMMMTMMLMMMMRVQVTPWTICCYFRLASYCIKVYLHNDKGSLQTTLRQPPIFSLLLSWYFKSGWMSLVYKAFSYIYHHIHNVTVMWKATYIIWSFM